MQLLDQNGEGWERTNQLRWVQRGAMRELQQAWVCVYPSDRPDRPQLGAIEWRDVEWSKE
jgi:hypothetical protein